MGEYLFNINGKSYTFSQLFQSGSGIGTSNYLNNGIELLQSFETGFSSGTLLENNPTNYLVNGSDVSSQVNPIRTFYTSSGIYTPGAVSIPSWCSKIAFVLIGAGGGGSTGFFNGGANYFASNGGDGGGGSAIFGIYNVPNGTTTFTYNLNVGGGSNIIFNDISSTQVNVYDGSNGSTSVNTTLGTPSSVNIYGGSGGALPTYNDPNNYLTNISLYGGNGGSNGSRLYTPSGYNNAPSSVLNNFPPKINQASATSGSVLAGWGNKGGDVPTSSSTNATLPTNAFIQYWFLY